MAPDTPTTPKIKRPKNQDEKPSTDKSREKPTTITSTYTHTRIGRAHKGNVRTYLVGYHPEGDNKPKLITEITERKHGDHC